MSLAVITHASAERQCFVSIRPFNYRSLIKSRYEKKKFLFSPPSPFLIPYLVPWVPQMKRVRQYFLIIRYCCKVSEITPIYLFIYLLTSFLVFRRTERNPFSLLRNWMSILFSAKRIKTSFAQFCLFKINNNTYRLYMLTPNCNIIHLSWKRKSAQYDYHTMCPLTINKQTMDIIDFISVWQYMLDSANYWSKIHLRTNCNFTQVRTVTSDTNSFF